MTCCDRIDAYHARMEQVLTCDCQGFDATGLATLREDAAVIAGIIAHPGVAGCGRKSGCSDVARRAEERAEVPAGQDFR